MGSFIKDAFAKGDYVAVLQAGDQQSWQYFAALGICGHYEEGLNGLADFEYDESKFYQAAIHWMAGNDDIACSILETINEPNIATRKLQAYLDKEVINILAMMPWKGMSPHVLYRGGMTDSKFDIRNVQTQGPVTRAGRNDSVFEYLEDGWKPDLLVSQMLEWQRMPTDLHDLNCPKFGVSADYDIHFHPIKDWLKSYDELIVSDTTELTDLSGLFSGTMSSYPRIFGFNPEDFEEVNNKREKAQVESSRKHIDLFMELSCIHIIQIKPLWYIVFWMILLSCLYFKTDSLIMMIIIR